MAGNLLMSVSKDERERAVFRSRRMYETDFLSNLATAEDRGRREGMTKGIAVGVTKGKVEVARNLLLTNFPLDEVIALTGLSREEVENLRGN